MERVGRRKLLYLHAARRLEELRVPPGNRLEALKGDRAGQHSIRINSQWRICFVWSDNNSYEARRRNEADDLPLDKTAECGRREEAYK